MERRPEELRNVALIGHGSSGKTSLAEAMLFTSKTTTKPGKVDDGTSNLDFEPEEIERRMTINPAFHHLVWKEKDINVIDTPGEDNFLSDTRFSLQAVDGALVVVDASAGVKVGTEKVWGFADEQAIIKFVFVNGMDRERADFLKVLEEIDQTFKVKTTPLFLPIGAEDDFAGLVDLIRMRALISKKDGSGKSGKGEIPADMREQVNEWREKMIENVVEADDELMEKYLEGEELSSEQVESTLFHGIRSGLIVPVIPGSAFLNVGVSEFLDLLTVGVPSPIDIGAKRGRDPATNKEVTRDCTEDSPFSALVFKTLLDPFSGKLSVLRVFSGILDPDSQTYNPNKGVKEKIGHLLRLEGKKQKSVEKAVPGDIVAIAKLKETQTGDTLCLEKAPIVYESASPAPAVLSYAVEPKARGTEEKVFSSLAKIIEEDPALRLERDRTTSESILSGTGQIHLEVTCEKLKRKFGVEVELKPIKVPYRETIKRPVNKVIYRHKKQSGGRGQFAEVHFDVSPLERDTGFEFEEALVGMNVPRNFVPAVEKGLNESLQSGILAGYPVVDLKVRFFDGKSHEVDSSEMAFKIAASMCLKKALQEANPTLLEPIVKMEIRVPEEVMGDVMGDLNSRRGRVLGMDADGKYQVIKAQAPLAEVLQYALDLNSMTGGRGSFSMEHSHYEEVPAQLAEKVIEASQKEE